MSLRTIMVFPQFPNQDIIERIRAQYDPLSTLVRPHITLVFPFDSPMSDEELSSVLEHRLSGMIPFELSLHGVSRHTDDSGNYLFLGVLRGKQELCAINRLLYGHEFRAYDRGLPYLPHMTLGNLPSRTALDEALAHVGSLCDVFCTTVDTISVERIGACGESVIVLEKKLG